MGAGTCKDDREQGRQDFVAGRAGSGNTSENDSEPRKSGNNCCPCNAVGESAMGKNKKRRMIVRQWFEQDINIRDDRSKHRCEEIQGRSRRGEEETYHKRVGE